MNILQRITKEKRIEIERRRVERPVRELRAAATDAPPVRSFAEAIGADAHISLIAEVKKASPSRGLIRADFDPVDIAQRYERSGARCISVLTDTPFFQGRLQYLTAIRRSVALPLLRKDFILDPYQVWEARAAGADAVLLIAECLPGPELKQLHDQILELGMTPLVELYDPANVDRVVDCGARLIGINNRNLTDFQVDIDRSVRIKRDVPSDRWVVAESGIESAEDVRRLAAAGMDAMLVGESLMRSTSIERAVAELLEGQSS